MGQRTFAVTGTPEYHYLEDPVHDLKRVVNGMTYNVSRKPRDYKAMARAEGRPLLVSFSDRPNLGGVRSGIAYDPKTDYYYVVCHASVGCRHTASARSIRRSSLHVGAALATASPT